MKYFLYSILFFLLTPLIALAQQGGATPIPLGTYINVAIGLGVAIAVVMFAFGGLQYMMSEAFTSKDEAKGRMTNAVIGLVIILSSYLILQTINPNIVGTQLDTAFFQSFGEVSSPAPEPDPTPTGDLRVAYWQGRVAVYRDETPQRCDGDRARHYRITSATSDGCRNLGNSQINTGPASCSGGWWVSACNRVWTRD